MAKLYYRYGAMGSGKSLDLLKTADNYERKGREVLILTPTTDTRDGVGVVSSRIGLERYAVDLHPTQHAINVVGIFRETREFDAVLVDEAQFLTKLQVEDLAIVADHFNIPVIAYGLKNDFKNHLFEGAAALLAYADSIEEIKTICVRCERKATMNLRTIDGNPVKEGDQILVGDDEYEGLCRQCYRKAMNNA
jgi:thymidine kinase